MKPYQPSNKITGAGFTWLLLSSTIGGATIGGLAHLLSRLVYLIVLFPIGMGLAGGGAIALAVRRGKVRNPTIATLFGLLTGLILYGCMHGAGYWQFKQTASEEITKELGAAGSAQADQLVDSYLQEKTGASGFWGYLKYSAQSGISIGRFGSKGANLGETGTWIYWVLELAAIESIIGAIAYSSAKEAFCENCNQWYSPKERVGSVEPQSSGRFLELLQQEQLGPAGQLLDPHLEVQAPHLQVRLQRCPSCQFSDLLLTVNKTSLDNKGKLQEKEATQGMISPGQYHQFQRAIPQPPPQQDLGNSEEKPQE